MFIVKRKCDCKFDKDKDHKKSGWGKSLIRIFSKSRKPSLVDGCRFTIKIGGKSDSHGRNTFFIFQLKDWASLEITDSNFNLSAGKRREIVVIGDAKQRECVNILITSCTFINNNSWGVNSCLLRNLWTRRSKREDCIIYVARCTFRGVRLLCFDGKKCLCRSEHRGFCGGDTKEWDQLIVFVAIDGQLVTQNTNESSSIFEIRNLSTTLWVLSILNSAFLVNNTNNPFVVDDIGDLLLSLNDTSFINVPNSVIIPTARKQPFPPKTGTQQSWLNASKIEGRLDLNLGAGVSIFNLSAASLDDVTNVIMNEASRLF